MTCSLAPAQSAARGPRSPGSTTRPFQVLRDVSRTAVLDASAVVVQDASFPAVRDA
jgi:hypothetical protein